MKICNFCVDISKNKKCKKNNEIALLIEQCFIEEDLKLCNERLQRQTDTFSSILADTTVVGYLELSEIRCYILKPSSKAVDECSVEVYLKVDHLSFEDAIRKCIKKINKKLEINNLEISSTINTIKIFPVSNNDIYDKNCRILAFYEKKNNVFQHWWPLFFEILALIISIIVLLLVKKDSSKSNILYGIISSLFVTGLLELFTCVRTYSRKINPNYDEIWDPDETIGNSFEVKKKVSPDDCEEE